MLIGAQMLLAATLLSAQARSVERGVVEECRSRL